MSPALSAHSPGMSKMPRDSVLRGRPLSFPVSSSLSHLFSFRRVSWARGSSASHFTQRQCRLRLPDADFKSAVPMELAAPSSVFASRFAFGHSTCVLVYFHKPQCA